MLKLVTLACLIALARGALIVTLEQDTSYMVSVHLIDTDEMKITQTTKLTGVPASYEHLALLRSYTDYTYVYLTTMATKAHYLVTLQTSNLKVLNSRVLKEEWIALAGCSWTDPPFDSVLVREYPGWYIEDSGLNARVNLTQGASSAPYIGLSPEFIYDWQGAAVPGGWLYTLHRSGILPYAQPVLVGASEYNDHTQVVHLNAINFRIYTYGGAVGVAWADSEWHVGFIAFDQNALNTTGVIETYLGNLGDPEWLPLVDADAAITGEVFLLYRNVDMQGGQSALVAFLPEFRDIEKTRAQVGSKFAVPVGAGRSDTPDGANVARSPAYPFPGRFIKVAAVQPRPS